MRAVLAILGATGYIGRLVCARARAAEALHAGEVTRVGALALAEASDARALIERLDPLLVIEAVRVL